jgi:hypothetical protein
MDVTDRPIGYVVILRDWFGSTVRVFISTMSPIKAVTIALFLHSQKVGRQFKTWKKAYQDGYRIEKVYVKWKEWEENDL